MLIFFFFQAEDGIRDSSVTGVQTCALPISTQPGCCEATSSGRTGTSRARSRSEERRVGKSVDLGGRRIIKKKKKRREKKKKCKEDNIQREHTKHIHNKIL